MVHGFCNKSEKKSSADRIMCKMSVRIVIHGGERGQRPSTFIQQVCACNEGGGRLGYISISFGMTLRSVMKYTRIVYQLNYPRNPINIYNQIILGCSINLIFNIYTIYTIILYVDTQGGGVLFCVFANRRICFVLHAVGRYLTNMLRNAFRYSFLEMQW